jgi:RNA polymerase sigma factor (sigma-70 family)
MATNLTSKVIQHLRKAVLLQDGGGMTDGQLLGRFIEHRDEAAFAALVKRHGPMVWGVCRRLLPHHDAEDAFQATFVVLVRKAACIMPKEMLANWLYGVAHQTALHSRRTTARRRTRERQVTPMPESAVAEQNLWHDLQPLLDQQLARLPDKYRVAIVLCDLEAKTRKEAARQLGCPEGTLAARLARGRIMLAKGLTRHGLAVSGGAVAAMLSQSAAAASLPPTVVSSTVQAGLLVAAGQAAAVGLISVKVAALTEGVLKAMLLTKLKNMIVLVGALSALVLGLGFSAYHGFAQQSANKNKTETVNLAAKAAADKDAAKPDDKKSETHYGWLVFGPKAKVRALVRLKGEEVGVDRDGDGKFDSKGERFKSEKDCKGVVIADPDGKTSYVITHVHVLHVVPPEKFMEVRVHIRGSLDYHQCGIIQMATDRKAAAQAYFHGPLTIVPKGWTIANRASRFVENKLVDLGSLLPQSLKALAGKGLVIDSTLPKSLTRGGVPTNLLAGIVTEGKNCIVGVCSPDDTDEGRREKAPFPKGVRPVVDVEFPAKKHGDPPNKKRYPLDQHLGDGVFRGPVRVPEEARGGKAKVTFSFDAWKGVKVAPTTVEIPLDDPPQEKRSKTSRTSRAAVAVGVSIVARAHDFIELIISISRP